VVRPCGEEELAAMEELSGAVAGAWRRQIGHENGFRPSRRSFL
jgi:hypothetical protein